MERFIARSNIDHYLGLLDGTGLGPEKRATITKLLIEEEDELSRDLEYLGFAERRAANGRERVKQVRNSRENFASGTSDANRWIVCSQTSKIYRLCWKNFVIISALGPNRMTFRTAHGYGPVTFDRRMDCRRRAAFR